MFKNLLEYLGKKASLEVDREGEITSFTLRVATAAVLWQVANSDDEYLDVEYQKIVGLLCKEFALLEEEADSLLGVAEKIAACDQVDELFLAINENFSSEQKSQVVNLAMQVAHVDGALKTTEVLFVEKLKDILSIDQSEQ